MIGLKRGLVKLEPYQEKWRNEAKQTIADLKSLLGDTAVDIQHIGSTAIPAIHAKPIIDIAVGVCDLKDIIPFIPLLENHNYIYRGQDAAEQILFVKPKKTLLRTLPYAEVCGKRRFLKVLRR